MFALDFINYEYNGFGTSLGMGDHPLHLRITVAYRPVQ